MIKTTSPQPNNVTNKEEASRNFDKRKTVNKPEDEANSAESFETVAKTTEEDQEEKEETTTTKMNRSRKIQITATSPNIRRPFVPTRAPKIIATSRQPTRSRSGGDTFVETSKTTRRPQVNTKKMEESATSAGSSDFLTGRPMFWIVILFVNTVLVFGFLILFAVCYYRSK